MTGVHDVANDITIRPAWTGGKTDAELATAIRQALVADQLVPHERIHSTVEGGLVTLSGTVLFASQRDDAARAIQHLAGVRGVSNEITIEPPHDVEPEAVRAAIEAAIARHAHRAARKVQLDIESGHVTLTGTIESAAERRAIVGAATATRGVRRVIDHLQVV